MTEPSAQSRSLKSQLRLYWLTAVICMGGMLFGYDSGVVGGVLTFSSFTRDFNYTAEEETTVSSLAIGIQQAGSFVAALAIFPITRRFGRRWTIVACSIVFIIGVVLETATQSLGCFYAGRVICGLGMGGSSTIVPIFLSEMAPKDSRGKLGSCYQLMYTVGILISYWIDYGVKFLDDTSTQWRIPIALQMVPAGLMGLGMLTLKESVRWLVSNGHTERAWESLVWIRASSDEDVLQEFEEIQEGVIADEQAQAGLTIRELLEWHNSKRLLLGFGIFVAQQSTGATALAYFGPQFFSLLVGKGDSNLLLSGIFGAVKFVACLTFVLFISERFGRKVLLLSGSVFMSACMVTTAAVLATHKPPGDGVITSAGIATVALIYLNIIVYNASWGPLPWPCTSELFNSRIREPGVAVGVSGQWLMNFVYSFSTPYMMDTMDWGTFLFYGVVDLFCGAFVWFCLKETQNKTLEEITAMYDPGHTLIPKKLDDEIEHRERV